MMLNTHWDVMSIPTSTYTHDKVVQSSRPIKARRLSHITGKVAHGYLQVDRQKIRKLNARNIKDEGKL